MEIMEITNNNLGNTVTFVSYASLDPIVLPASNVQGFKFRKTIKQPKTTGVVTTETDWTEPLLELPEQLTLPISIRPSIDTNDLLSRDIEDIFRQAGLTSINGKQLKFGSKELRALNASFGASNSNHKKKDPHTGYAMARDISIVGGNLDDYTEFRRLIMSNELISQYLDAKNWGIINEITPLILARTRGTGLHFHFGPDTWARRTWSGWKNNPDTPITTAL